ncbi:MAG: bacillithiol biosynthesis deacetylase BshB1 [Calditrichaeota bacterium]|nr:MAG: bacillithiol biosynthesis deacetylase BshB1 [Calditrichota bacterium]MBL1203859.1 bacillithiol biosynthesis deacetylase BshB1 [Calditrichota bacterium]NOG43691.1 bacillithiol biosynthesis deacetylase BshB1 [Calditrichota bacterium]
MQIDVLAFGAHPDDVELFCSGLLIKLKSQGHSIGVIDLTRGELSTRGTVELRSKEAQEASTILNLDIRENAGLSDGDIIVDLESKKQVIEIIRKYRPKIVLAPYWEDRHPDHISASQLVSASFFYSGLTKIKTEYEAYRPNNLIYYFHHEVAKPSFIVDISTEFKNKLQAVNAYKSQFFNSSSDEPETYISSPEFIESVKNRAKYFGFQIGVEYGEPFFVKSAIKLDNIIEIFA